MIKQLKKLIICNYINILRIAILFIAITTLMDTKITVSLNEVTLANISITGSNLVFAEENTTLPQGVNETKKILEQTALIENTLEIEEKEIAALSEYLEEIKNRKTEFDSVINVYKIELTTFGSQLHLPEVESKLIEKSYMSSQTAVGKVTKELSKLKEKREELKQIQEISYQQKMGNDKFLMELKNDTNSKSSIEQGADSAPAINGNKNPGSERESGTIQGPSPKDDSGSNQTIQTGQNRNRLETPSPEQQRILVTQQLDLGKHGDPQQRAALEQKLALEQQLAQEQTLLQAQKAEDEKKTAEEQKAALGQLQIRLQVLQTSLTKRVLLIQSVCSILNERIPVLEELQGKYKTLVGELEVRIRDAKKEELLTRKTNPLTQGTWIRMGEDINELISIVSSIFEKESWINSFSFLWIAGIYKLISFIVVLFILVMVAMRFKILIKKQCESSHLEKRYWSKMVLEIFGQNLMLSAITAFLYMCIKFKLFFSYSIIANLIVEIMMFLIFILWMVYFCEQIQKRYSDPQLKAIIFLREVILFLKVLNLVAVIYILLISSLKSDSSIVTAYRLVCEIIFYGWIIHFLKKNMPAMKLYFEEHKKKIYIIPALYKSGVVMIAIAGIILELMGYGTLAFYWYTSWGKTMVVLMWSGLLIGASSEWIPGGTHPAQQLDHEHGHLHAKNSFSMLWLIKQLSFIALFFLVTIALMLSWASSDFVFPGLYNILTYKLAVGSMRFSISSIAQAIMLLIITHFFAKSWRHFFQKNFLGNSGLDHGLQESMTTITVYSIWIFGIFIALITFGLNTTTLTVAFGALSIGLGFGLQNIFSNFISGIILLFERPIQVGDDIEVGGIWATVKKTNVRSTVVQTYDNATIIIPNSELISNRVTNWSFKDKRLRRKITVGVEYGSDIELVRKTLLEIARKTAKVLNYPEPDVLFEDFGDSALIFSLRFWTFIDYFIAIETDIRFKINKSFKEKGIVMAFPQQDINIKSLPLNFMAAPPLSDSKN